MIRLKLGVQNLQRMRFAYSPLAELVESLYAVHVGSAHHVHRGWRRLVANDLPRVDTPMLQAVVPTNGIIANVLLSGAVDARTSIEDQLEGVARCDVDRLADDLGRAWHGSELPAAAADLLAAGPQAPALLADELAAYWRSVIAPWWPHVREVLDADVAYRAVQVARGGFDSLLTDIHEELRLADDALEIVAPSDVEYDLAGKGVLLIPCVFAWPNLIVDPGRTGVPSIIYGPRGVGTLWEGTPATADADELGALLGRGRATVLRAVERPRATTELAWELGQTPSAVSSHLSVLRRCGLVTAARAGRRVLYQQTPLASSLLAAADQAEASAATRRAR